MTTWKRQREDFALAVKELYDNTALTRTLDMELMQVKPGEVTVEMVLAKPVTQQHGFAHAGTLAALVDTACGLAGFSLMAAGESVLSVNLNLSLLRPAGGERLRAVGRVIKAGRRIYFTQGEVYTLDGDQEKLCCTATVTLAAAQGDK